MKHIIPLKEYFEDWYTDDEIAKWVSFVMKSFGYDVPHPTRIGAGGANGDIFSTIKDDRILKVSKDLVEAANAIYLFELKVELKYFAKYYSAKRVKFEDKKDRKIPNSRSDDGMMPLYAILMEKLKPIKDKTPESSVLATVIASFITNHKKLGMGYSTFCNYNTEDYNTFLKDNPKEKVIERLKTKPNYNESQLNLAIEYIDALFNIMKEAKEYKIIIGDATPGNFGYNSSNTLVIFDLGGMSNAMDKTLVDKVPIVNVPSL